MRKGKLLMGVVSTFIAGIVFMPNTYALANSDCSDVKDEDTFKNCIGDTGVTEIKLGDNLDLSSYVTLKHVVNLDLNGKTLTRQTDHTGSVIILVDDGGDLTVQDSQSGGKIYNSRGNRGDSAIMMQGESPKLTINGGTIEGAYTGIGSSSSLPNSESITINGGTIKGQFGIGVFGNNATLTVKGGTISATSGFAVAGNGANTQNATINIEGGTLISTDNAAIYKPNTGTLNISGGDITGLIGVAAFRGKVNITGGKIAGTGTAGQTTTNVGEAKDTEGNPIELPLGVAAVIDNTAKLGYEYDDDTKANMKIEGDVLLESNDTPIMDLEDEDSEINVFVGTGVTSVQKINLAYISDDLVQDPITGAVMTKTDYEQLEADRNSTDENSESSNVKPPKTGDINLVLIISAILTAVVGAVFAKKKIATRVN